LILSTFNDPSVPNVRKELALHKWWLGFSNDNPPLLFELVKNSQHGGVERAFLIGFRISSRFHVAKFGYVQDNFRCETTESNFFLGAFAKFNWCPARDSHGLGQTKHRAEIVETNKRKKGKKELRKVLESGNGITDFDFCSVVSNLGIGHRSFLHSSKRDDRGPPFFMLTVTRTAIERTGPMLMLMIMKTHTAQH